MMSVSGSSLEYNTLKPLLTPSPTVSVPLRARDVVTSTSTAKPGDTDGEKNTFTSGDHAFYSTVVSTRASDGAAYTTGTAIPVASTAVSSANNSKGNSPKSSKHASTAVIAGPIVGVLGALIIVVFFFYCLRHYKRKRFLAEQQEFETQFEEEKSRLAAMRKNNEHEKMGYRGGYQMHSSPWGSVSRSSMIGSGPSSYYYDKRSSDYGLNNQDFVTPPGNAATSDSLRFLKRNSVISMNGYSQSPPLEARRSVSYGAVQSPQGRPLAPIPGRRTLSFSSVNDSNEGNKQNSSFDSTENDEHKSTSTESSSELFFENDDEDKHQDPFVMTHAPHENNDLESSLP
ncbi:Schizosaccharomyces specific protein [Schizosaccharomyces osmophilus]|uniref:Schizosaccharomyces specific protein n=1 Tax=Schizosaccharomyces osmophilus TaxID=2545709 RepID=A0AAE9WDM9_9SCHI|nr:Schizosaccharomyces specific protein [Schizosaccharomyces osmophilus]WBW72788.1 Schizosaccharomyces specific protein [Schizosaccharomyces osmophilus]